MTEITSRPRVLGAALTFGFGTAVAMWCAWWITHVPAIAAPRYVTGPLLMAVMLAGMIGAGRAAKAPAGWRTGLGAGIIASALNLLVVLSFVARPPHEGYSPAPGFEGLTSDSALAVLGFMALGAAVGAFGGTVGALRASSTTVRRSDWLPVFAWVACASVIPLLIVGGAVTSTSSGMAVPGWPDTFGANMFLYPIKFMSQPRIFLEHTHRLLGSLVGLTTLTLMVWCLISAVPRAVKLWSIGAFLLVCAQGVLGGIRVNNASTALAFVHGVTAQLFFAVLVCIAVNLGPTRTLALDATPEPRDRRRRAFSMALQHSTLLQLILGAAFRHFGQAGKGGMHALWAHAGFSLVVVAMAVLAGALLRTRTPATDVLNSRLRRLGGWILGVVCVQFFLGVGAFITVLGSGQRGPSPGADELATARPIDALPATIATLHQANGALLLALATGAVVLTRRLWKQPR